MLCFERSLASVFLRCRVEMRCRVEVAGDATRALQYYMYY